MIAVGKKLVAELSLGRPDTLCEWMAHYVAELLDKTSTASEEEKPGKQQQCFDAILKLWSHRAALPDGRRPLESFEPIIRALESLDPESEQPRYLRTIMALHPGVEAPSEPEVRSLFEWIRLIDQAARTTIGHALAKAADAATDKDREWVTLARDAAGDGGLHILLIRFIEKAGDGADEDGKSTKENERS